MKEVPTLYQHEHLMTTCQSLNVDSEAVAGRGHQQQLELEMEVEAPSYVFTRRMSFSGSPAR